MKESTVNDGGDASIAEESFPDVTELGDDFFKSIYLYKNKKKQNQHKEREIPISDLERT
jgi:hypothetical protein